MSTFATVVIVIDHALFAISAILLIIAALGRSHPAINATIGNLLGAIAYSLTSYFCLKSPEAAPIIGHSVAIGTILALASFLALFASIVNLTRKAPSELDSFLPRNK
jgi:hypothetical protein